GIYPAVDPLDSTSTMLQPDVVGGEHYTTARAVQSILQPCSELNKKQSVSFKTIRLTFRLLAQ
ncbi:MAG: hypothetical protein AAGA62_07180, partial [Bacteroidota bacterium]